MKLATIESILDLAPLPNSDSLDLVTVLGYKCIVRRGQFAPGEAVVLIHPDTVLPEKPWAEMYRKRSGRVKAIRLRGTWSFGIVEKPETVGYAGERIIGLEISEAIGVTKYDPPQPQDLQARGGLPYGIPVTDEERYQSLEAIPYGTLVDVTLKVDGQSWSAYCKKQPDGAWVTGVLGRKLEYKTDAMNNYTSHVQRYGIFDKLLPFCQKHDLSLCLRGESYGTGIQSFSINPHARQPLGLALFSVYLMDAMRYARKSDPYYIFNVARELGLPTVPLLEENVPLTPELIKRYDEDLQKVNGSPFEGVVINTPHGSFKIINKHYDSAK